MERLRKIKQSTILLGLAVIVLAFVGGYSLSQSSARKNDQVSSSSCKGTCISLYSDKADPEVLTVASGSFVQFNAADGKKHNIALEHSGVQHEDEHTYESGDFGYDEAWRVQFKKDGTYTFRDKYHDKIKVSVVVYTEGKDYKITR